jgi:hypothetical protein
MRIKPWLVVAFVLFCLWRLYSQRDISHAPGVLAPDDPVQTELEGAAAVDRGEFKLRPRADFSATVRVLHREDYHLGELARLVPTDFAVGWGPMSDSRVLADIDISQGNRFYFWSTRDWPIDRPDIESHSANWHVIPANDRVRSVLDKLRIGSVVKLEGRLVDVEGKEARMTTSMTRSDTGAGACEILLATSARIVEVRK